MKVPFLDKEILTVNADKERLLKTINEHTNSDNRTFEKMFIGEVGDSRFKLVGVKKFGPIDYSVTVMRGQVKTDNGNTQLQITFSLMWLYASQLLAEILFFSLFAILVGINSNAELRDISLVAVIGLPIITFTTLRYKRRYEEDREKYKSILEGLVYRSKVR